jgi:hypothetical protein
VRTPPQILKRDGSVPSPEPTSSALTAQEERSERIRFSLPLLLLAGASLVTSYVLYHDSFAPHATRVPLWVLAFSVGLIASVGGSTAYFVGDFSGVDWLAEARGSPEYVVVDRRQWSELQARLRAAPSNDLPSSEEFEIPEWSEPTVGPGAVVTEETPDPVGPPTPMSVTHGIDSLATEVDRLVADLEAAATVPPPKESSLRAPADLSRTSPVAAQSSEGTRASPPPRGSSAVPPGPLPGSGRPSRSARGTGPSPPTARGLTGPSTSRAPATRDDAVSAEYRALLAELEARAAKGTTATRLPPPRPAAAAHDARCVGCDARLGANDRNFECRSCSSRMCGSCRDRSAREGYRDLCAVCSILAESQGRDAPGPA